MAKSGAPAKPRRRRGLLALFLGALVIAAVAGVLVWQDKTNRANQLSGPSPTWRA